LQAAALAPLLGLLPARASPSAEALKGLQLVVPTPPGAQPDLIARWLAEPLSRAAGVPVVVFNRPGAAGAIAAEAVLALPPPSGPLLLGGLDHVAYSHVNGDRRALDPFVDFVPVATVNRDAWVVAVPANSSVRALHDLVEHSRRGRLAYASGGEGSTAHLLSARLARAVGIEALHVAYRDPWMPDLLAGRIQFVVVPVPAVLPQLRAERLRALATLTEVRIALPGDPPSIAELGWPGQAFHGGLFVFAPASLAALASRLNGWFVTATSEPAVLSHYREASIEPTPYDLAQTAAAVRERLRTVDAMRLAEFGRSR
jgi:tripartite-type tricarboxylate transporter receptor subunit TctC